MYNCAAVFMEDIQWLIVSSIPISTLSKALAIVLKGALS